MVKFIQPDLYFNNILLTYNILLWVLVHTDSKTILVGGVGLLATYATHIHITHFSEDLALQVSFAAIG